MKELFTDRRYSISEINPSKDEILHIYDKGNIFHYKTKEDPSVEHKRCHDCDIFLDGFENDICRSINCTRKYFRKQK